ncbi:C40 family peptidase [Desulfosporosinus orientis]|nr:C40 family peptidase [Desulfosporosinus orientis]
MESYIAVKPSLLASTTLSKQTYTQAVRKEMQWVESPIKTNNAVIDATASEKPVSTLSKAVAVVATEQKVQPTVSERKTVQVAEVQLQVSRSQNTTLVDNAVSLVGVPYVFGGTSRKGFDCSGYTQYVFKGSGISLPRTSWSQFNVGLKITKDQLQTGDLLFFSTYAKGPSHVGIYIGGGNFIHASNSGVRITSLNDNYYAKRYLGARRVS